MCARSRRTLPLTRPWRAGRKRNCVFGAGAQADQTVSVRDEHTRPAAKHASAEPKLTPPRKRQGVFGPPSRGGLKRRPAPASFLFANRNRSARAKPSETWRDGASPPFLLPLTGRTEEGVPAQASGNSQAARANEPEPCCCLKR